MRPDAEKRELPDVEIAEFDQAEMIALHDLYMLNWANNYVFVRTTRPDIGEKENERVFVAKRKRKMVGSIFYRPANDHAYLLNIVVKTDCRGQGIGGALIKFAEEQAAKDGLAQITIKARSDQLVEYYQHLGFRLMPDSPRQLMKDVPKLA